MTAFFNWFVKITGWLPQKIVFRTKVYYQDKSVQSSKIKGPAIIVCNHTSLYDYAAMLFTFFSRTLRFQMAEVLFQKKLLGGFLKAMGGIKVDRNSSDFGFMRECKEILDKGGVVGVFPEGRLPLEGEEVPLPFKSGATYLALYADVPIVPVFTNGQYFGKKRAKVVIGKPIWAKELYNADLSEKENLAAISEYLRQTIVELGKIIDEQEKV